MRIVAAGHSLAAERQARFFDYFGSLNDVELLQIYPSEWGRDKREGGHDVMFPGDMQRFLWPGNALMAIKTFKPDVIYLQQEAWHNSFKTQLHCWAKGVGIPLVLFVWENLRPLSTFEAECIKDCAAIVCGNRTAEVMVRGDGFEGPTTVMPQVGVDYDLFKPMPEIEKDHDVVFLGRPVPEKGILVLEKAMNGLYLKLLTTKELEWCDWSKTPGRYNRARVHVSVPIATPQWREQWLSYAHAEALGCGLFCVGSDTPEIAEQSDGCPGFFIAKQKDVDETRRMIQWALEQPVHPYRINEKGRRWAINWFSQEVIARRLRKFFSLI